MLKNKFITFSLIVVLGLLFIAPSGTFAHESDLHDTSITEVLQEIVSQQQVDALDKLDCSKITDEQFEQLGEVWMEQMHPGDSHEYMDQMMGGEGSDNLRLAHIQMGQNYLGCGTSQYGMMGSGMMMGGGMMGGYTRDVGMMQSDSRKSDGQYHFNGIYPYSSMMNYQNSGSGWFIAHAVLSAISWILVVIVLLLVIRLLWHKGNKK